MSLSAFFRDQAIKPENQKIIVSERFQENGKSIPWEIRAITEEEDAKIKEDCTTVSIFKGRQTTKFHNQKYTNKVIAACVVFPDLKNAELQKSYGVVSDDALVQAMLLPGEHTNLLQIINEINGFDAEKAETAKEEIKNS
ncbi:phage tail assembly chaperone [Faecalispora anaeroviscerum]|uniref:phage tail assembly chaperone n=1 Tax=Faecalispora anaeroviscerum TaxID=2991836 RepID=UPI0024B8E8A9|nr:phage portal protein [Faecalispora anaeroviscerum]